MISGLKTKYRRKLIEWLYGRNFARATFVRSEKVVECLKSSIRERIPTALGRLGINELNAAIMYSKVKHPRWVRYDQDYVPKGLNVNVGVFPREDSVFERWSADYLKANKDMDILAVYLNVNELYYIRKYLSSEVKLSRSWVIHPMLPGMNWMEACNGKKVLVVSQNIGTIRTQLSAKEAIWSKIDFDLPDADYSYIKPSFSPAVDPSNQAGSWFEELERLKSEMDRVDYDVALIAAGGYANFLAAHAKKRGKVGINMGGALDPLYGIKTKRYAGGNNAMPATYMNDAWVFPAEEDKPKNSNSIEDGCYW